MSSNERAVAHKVLAISAVAAPEIWDHFHTLKTVNVANGNVPFLADASCPGEDPARPRSWRVTRRAASVSSLLPSRLNEYNCMVNNN